MGYLKKGLCLFLMVVGCLSFTKGSEMERRLREEFKKDFELISLSPAENREKVYEIIDSATRVLTKLEEMANGFIPEFFIKKSGEAFGQLSYFSACTLQYFEPVLIPY